MKDMIHDIGIQGYRSFGTECQFLRQMKKINILIGKNNSGKSNILQFLLKLNSTLKGVNSSGSYGDYFLGKDGLSSSVALLFSKTQLEKQLKEKKIQVGDHALPITSLFPDEEIWLSQDIYSNRISVMPSLEILSLPESYFPTTLEKIGPNKNEFLSEQIHEAFRSNFYESLKKLPEVYYVPHTRAIGNNELQWNTELKASNIVAKLATYKSPKVGEDAKVKKFEQILEVLRNIFSNESIDIDIPSENPEIIIKMDGKRLELKRFGTGLNQLILLICSVVMHENALFCIEEPEVFLHPELQRKLINFLAKTNNTYLITTHSNAFLDSQKDTAIFHVQNDGFSSKIYPVNSKKKGNHLLDDLGYRNSDLLQSNGIIWVEGPSDRIYIQKWISLLDEELIEGIHYSIMFYGGSSRSHITFSEDETTENFIELLKMNRNVWVHIDRDGDKEDTKPNKTKLRVICELSGSDTGSCWITNGREIENYLYKPAVDRWLESKNIHLNEFTIDLNKKFETIIESATNKKINYDSSKVKFAREIVHFITDISNLDVLDLKSKLEELVASIRKWNGL
jgi:AAA15 family ATPase/GTPase